jgi:hypothetical protein
MRPSAIEMRSTDFDQSTAERIVEQLRYGVPPPEHVRAFTVGRGAQLRALEESLGQPSDGKGSALLVKANYGSGKSHLLKVVREMALQAGYAVSLVVIDAQGGVRFNRMDTIFGAICRELEVANQPEKGIGALFDAFANIASSGMPRELQRIRERISSNGKWDLSDFLKSPALYVALRAWVRSGTQDVRDLVSDWFENPANYRGQRKRLYSGLVENLRGSFRDTRREWQFYADEVFAFHTGGHRQAWDALADFHTLALAAGLRGFVLLFDEFEDVIQNLNRRNLQEAAFLNLFRFFDGDRFPGMSYFAVTPDFVAKCKTELLQRGVYDFDYRRFDHLPFFEMEPIQRREFADLARRIRTVYGTAYDTEAERLVSDRNLDRVVDDLWTVRSPDRVRRAIQGVVKSLDDGLDERD